MRALLLIGHERPLTHVQYNRTGDLLFSCAKDSKPTVWFSDNGERLGTYNGHNGAVWHLDVNWHSTLLITGGADATARIWRVENGKELARFHHKAPVRNVKFAEGDQLFLTCGDKAMGQEPQVFVYAMPDLEGVEESIHNPSEPLFSLRGHTAKISRAEWTSLNEKILTASDDGTVRLWDVETQQEISRSEAHEGGINNLKMFRDKSMFITSSKDKTSKVFDTRDLRCLYTYHTEQPVNDALIAPYKSHIILGGGQEAMSVTQTHARAGKFEAHFYHLYHENWLGSLKGHFGPINALAIHPEGKSYASGAEDGFVRLHHFDDSYFQIKLD